MKAKKVFCVVAYDVSDSKRRQKVVKALEKYGIRINFSVFECMVAPSELEILQEKIGSVIDERVDTVVYYPICVNCFTKIIYQPGHRRRQSERIVTI